MKRLFSLFLSICLVMSLTVSATALSPKATNRVDVTVRPNTITRIGTGLSLETDELVTINCTYSPRSADVDFGLITPENKFRYLSGKSGSCKFAIEIPETGTYYFAVNNNANETVRVLGFVYY